MLIVVLWIEIAHCSYYLYIFLARRKLVERACKTLYGNWQLMKFWNKRTSHKRVKANDMFLCGQNYADLCKLNLQSCRFYIFIWKPKCLTVIHSKRTGLFLNVVVHSVDTMSGRSDLHFPIADGFAIASSWHVCYFYSLVAAYCVWSLTGSIRPLFVFAILAQPALRAPQIISGFSDIRIVLKWGFTQAGAGVIFNNWAQTKVKIA